MKSRIRDAIIVAPGKRSAARGYRRKVISSFFPFLVWRAGGAPDQKRKKGGRVAWCFTPGGGLSGLARGYNHAAPLGLRKGERGVAADTGRPPRLFSIALCPARLHSVFGVIEDTMKTILTFVLLSFLFAGCSRRDATTQNELTGTWTLPSGSGLSVTNIIAPDGSYHCQLAGGPNGQLDTLEGTLIAKNGVLIDTVTKESGTNLPTPRVMRWQILRIDRHELVLSGANGAAMTAVRNDK